jgi:hypothetical protein
VSASSSGQTVLRPDEGQFDTLPLLGLDSEELLHEERAARRAAAVVVDLVQRLDAPPIPEADAVPRARR